MTGHPSYDQAVLAWAAHLRAGGTTPWSDWEHTTADRRDEPLLRPTPDAIHLELVRRINLAAQSSNEGVPRDLAGLADRVFATASPGRGLLDVPLPWPADPWRFGTPAIDPGTLPAEELIRLSVGVLTHLLPGVRRPAPARPRSRWPTPWRRRFRLHGSPATVASLRQGLLAQGHIETDRRPTHVVIARPVEVMMAEHWASTVRDGGILKWSTTWRRAEAAGRLPAPIDISGIVQRLEGRRREPLHLVIARDADQAADLTTAVLRARRVQIRGDGDAALSDLLRRLNRLSALAHGPGRVRDLSRTLVALLDDVTDPPGDVAVLATPIPSLPWARAVAATTAEHVRHAGYAVHGNPDDLAPSEHQLPGTVDREHTLELAVTACLRTWHQGGDP
jgi:hypothetical protein